jgi:hypothetical protein
MRKFRPLSVLLAVLFAVPAAWPWGAHVHRTLTYLALDGLPADAPAWMREPAVRQRIAFEANQPDRWRGWDSVVLKHENDPEHYLDVEYLDQFGLTLETLPRLRNEYVRVMVVAKTAHPEKVAPYDAEKDPARTHEWPGFVLYAVADHYAKLQAAFNQVRILEQLNDPTRREQLEQSRALAIVHLGALAHFVEDMAQPLHTTKHHNGWVGENPAGYKWRDRFHSYIDEGWADKHHVTRASLKSAVKYAVKVDAADPWNDVLAYMRRSHAQMEPLYALERDGQLDGPEGEKLITTQLGDAASTLSALVWAAYTSAEPTPKQVESWVHYEGNDSDAGAPAPPPTPSPAGAKSGE